MKKPMNLTKEQAQAYFDKLQPNLFTQGSCYRTEVAWKDVEPDEIVYIPEYGYEYREVEDLYTKQDLINAVVEYDFPEKYAETLLDMLDWQSPYTFLNEIDDSEFIKG